MPQPTPIGPAAPAASNARSQQTAPLPTATAPEPQAPSPKTPPAPAPPRTAPPQALPSRAIPINVPAPPPLNIAPVPHPAPPPPAVPVMAPAPPPLAIAPVEHPAPPPPASLSLPPPRPDSVVVTARRVAPAAVPRTDPAASLRAAAAAGRTTELATLLDQGVPVDAPDADGDTALMKSIQADQPAAASLLRRHGASLDLTNHAGESARAMATAKGDPALNQAMGLAP